MKLIIAKDYKEMSKIAMQHLLGYMYNNQYRVNISITGGTTPVKMYELMVPEIKGSKYLDHVHYYNFDEIPHKVKDEEGVTITELRRLFFKPAEIKEENIHILSEHNYIGQDERIKNDGGLDVVILGIGEDGHYCGNLPGTTGFNDFTSRVECNEKIKTRISRLFEDKEDVPDYYITMGPASIMAAKHIIMIASGEKKADIIDRFVNGNLDVNIPASLLRLHPNISLIVDEDAGKNL